MNETLTRPEAPPVKEPPPVATVDEMPMNSADRKTMMQMRGAPLTDAILRVYAEIRQMKINASFSTGFTMSELMLVLAIAGREETTPALAPQIDWIKVTTGTPVVVTNKDETTFNAKFHARGPGGRLRVLDEQERETLQPKEAVVLKE